MKKWISRILAGLLVSGLVVDPAVAWGLAASWRPVKGSSAALRPVFAEEAIVQALKAYFRGHSTFDPPGSFEVAQSASGLLQFQGRSPRNPVRVYDPRGILAKNQNDRSSHASSRTSARPAPTAIRNYEDIRKDVLKKPIHIFMENEAADLEEIGEWAERHMSLGYVLLQLALRDAPTRWKYEEALTNRTRTEAVGIAADGTRVAGVPPDEARKLKETAHVYRRINPPDAFVQNIVFRKRKRTTSFYMIRGTGDQKDDLIIKPEHFSKKGGPKDNPLEAMKKLVRNKIPKRVRSLMKRGILSPGKPHTALYTAA